MLHDSCRQCTKRRIKCDGGEPSCFKCIKKGLACSGRIKIYRFEEDATPSTTGSFASTENSPGALPQGTCMDVITHNTPTTAASSSSTACSETHETSGMDEDDDYIVDGTQTRSSDSGPLFNQIVPHWQAQVVSSSAVNIHDSRYPLGYSLQALKPGHLMLFDHFAKVIAPYMTVANEVEHNGYRDLILPLAHEDSLVQRAVVVVSALHLSPHNTTLRYQAEIGRTTILTRLREDVMIGGAEGVSNVSTWATLLLLLVGETVTGSSDFVQLFSMLRSQMTLQEGSTPGSRVMSKFLDYQRRIFLFYTPPLLGATQPVEPWSASEAEYFEFFGLSSPMEPSHYHNVANIVEANKIIHTLVMEQNSALLTDDAVNLTLYRLRSLVAPITRSTPGAHTLVWVYFIAAAESRTFSHRTFFSLRLGELYEIGRFGNIPVALATLDKIWALDSQQRWTRETNIIVPVLVI